MINTSIKLKALSDAATQGELSVSSGEMCTISDSKGRIANMCFVNLTGRRNEEETVDTAHFLAALVNAYRSGQLVHVDEAENKLTLPDCPKALWAQHFLGRSDWQVSENVTCASKGVMEAEKFVNERELRGLADEVEKLREALDRAAFVLATMPDIALRVGLQGTSQWDEIAGGVDLFGALDAARAALGDSQ